MRIARKRDAYSDSSECKAAGTVLVGAMNEWVTWRKSNCTVAVEFKLRLGTLF